MARAHAVELEKRTGWRCGGDGRSIDTNRKEQGAGGNAAPAEQCARHGGGGAGAWWRRSRGMVEEEQRRRSAFARDHPLVQVLLKIGKQYKLESLDTPSAFRATLKAFELDLVV
jgi:hypothetical protein